MHLNGVRAAPLLALALVLAPGVAHADPCAHGRALAAADEPARAHRYLEGCDDAASRRDLARVRRALRASELTPVNIVITPAGAEVIIRGFDDDRPVRSPATVWLAAGSYEVDVRAPGHAAASIALEVDARSRASLVLRLEPAADEIDHVSVDFGAEEGFATGERMATRDPEAVEHDSLLADRYRRGLEARGDGTAPAPAPSRVGFGLRAGLEIADQAGREATLGPSVGLLASLALGGRLSLRPELGLASRGTADAPARYVAVPLPAMLALARGAWHAAVGAGPEVAILAGDGYDRFDVGAVALAAAGRGQLSLEVRARHGLIAAAAGQRPARSVVLGLAWQR